MNKDSGTCFITDCCQILICPLSVIVKNFGSYRLVSFVHICCWMSSKAASDMLRVTLSRLYSCMSFSFLKKMLSKVSLLLCHLEEKMVRWWKKVELYDKKPKQNIHITLS